MKKLIAMLMSVTIFLCGIIPVNATSEEGSTATEEESLTVYSQEDSTAEESTTASSVVLYYGDVNEDGRVAAGDARNVLRFAAAIIYFTGRQMRIGDITGDGRITASDARHVLRMSAELEELKIYDVGETDDDTNVYANFSVYDPETTTRAKKTGTPYVSTLSGFDTNITDENVFGYLSQLESYLRTLGGSTTTFCYMDVNREYYITYKADTVFRTQCTIKAPYCKALLEYLEANNIPLTYKIQLLSSHKWTGHYMSRFYSGSWHEVGDVIYYCLHYSDNTAYDCLTSTFGYGILNNNAEKVGSYLRLNGYMFGENSAFDMTKLFLDIYDYDGIYREWLYNIMENNESRNRIPAGIPSGTRVINKIGTGGDKTKGYHDCAVVFTEVPYALCIYTDYNYTKGSAKYPFGNIAGIINNINTGIEY